MVCSALCVSACKANRGGDDMRSVYMGDCRLGGGTVRYHLLVEEVEEALALETTEP